MNDVSIKCILENICFFSSRSIEIQIIILIQITLSNTLDFQISITIYSWHLSDKYLYMLVILWGGDYIIHIVLWNKEETFTIQIKTDNAITNCLIIMVFVAFIIIRMITKYLFQTYHLKVTLKRNYIKIVMILIFPSPTSLT